MRHSPIIVEALQRLVRLVVLIAVFLSLPSGARATCVGDCGDHGAVSISDLILGVNIALGLLPADMCPPFQNSQGEVDISQLIQGVNNALFGCPPEPTASTTATPANTATTAATATASATNTLPSPATPTHTTAPTSSATATHTGMPTGTATATITITPLPTGTAMTTVTNTPEPTEPATETIAASPTATDTAPPLASSSVTATATNTGMATATATEPLTPSSTATASSTPTASDTATVPSTPTVSGTSTVTPTATPSDTPLPIGELIGGRVAVVSAGLGSLQSVIAAVAEQATNGAGAQEVTASLGGDEVQVTDINMCPISGTSNRTCTEMGSGVSKTIQLVLDATDCVVGGPAGGTAQFNGKIAVDANPFFLNSCSPLHFVNGSFAVGDLDTLDGPPLQILFRDSQMQQKMAVSALLSGSVAISSTDPSCLIGSLSLNLTGQLTTQLADGSAFEVNFDDTSVVIDMISYNQSCVPVAYRLKFNGFATITLNPGLGNSATTNGLPSDSFNVAFDNLFITQNVMNNPATAQLSGGVASGCFGGAVGWATVQTLAISAGELCPDAGQLTATAGAATATVTYENGAVTIAEGGSEKGFGSCLASDLLMCVPQ